MIMNREQKAEDYVRLEEINYYMELSRIVIWLWAFIEFSCTI